LADELGLFDCELLVGLETDLVGLLHGFLADEGRHLLQLSGDLVVGEGVYLRHDGGSVQVLCST